MPTKKISSENTIQWEQETYELLLLKLEPNLWIWRKLIGSKWVQSGTLIAQMSKEISTEKKVMTQYAD